MKKLLSILLVSLLIFSLAACSQETSTNDEPKETGEDTPEVVTTASIVNENAAFLNAISPEGNWIVAILEDLTFDKEIVVDGDFHNKGDEAQDLYRKLAIYAQDENHNVTERYTLTAPKLTVKSPNFKIQGGTFVGDVYVEAEGFTVQDATIDGNVYFASEELKSTLNTEKEGKITGETAVKGNSDVVTTASIVNENAAFLNAISPEGNWIVAILEDLTFDKEIVVDGDFHNKGDKAQDLYRKLALYAQDENRNVTARYTLTAPKLTVKSPNFKIQGGTFVGDVYVEAEGFTVQDATIDGNVYFASEELKATLNTEKDGTITGETAVK